jgi:hypothetical protein
MNPVKPLLLAGLASVAVAGLAGLAHAGQPDVKTMTVQLPGGGTEQIEYTGDVAPQVILEPAAAAAPADAAFPFASADPFAAIAQISAEMDSQAAAMMNAMNAMTAGALASPGALVPADALQLPPGGARYSFVSSLSGGAGGACMRSVEITAMGNGQAPRVVSQSSGDCGGAPGMASPAGAEPAALPAAPAPVQQPQLIPVRYLMPRA